ncbi:hypothetical protein HP567_006130 [Brevibacillus sp. M2.1A]|uniref:hypothetical protein n=1 Tax=Brevibacillus sp. M2.1A TaxID=2738980 RepID=UPI00156B531A|nr:hypothetical protein [Brevibacillus sp. M2.1A]MCC8434126.1 hypothetical protein [Brevibacillus sp. M2.1A]
MLKKAKVSISAMLLASIFYMDTTTILAKSNDNLSQAEMKKLKEIFKFSDQHIEDLIEDGFVQDYLSMEKPVVSKKEEYYELTKEPNGKVAVEQLTKKEFDIKVTENQETNEEKEKDAESGLISTLGHDIEDRHDYITLETWFIYDEVDWDAQASARFEFADNSSTYGFTEADLYDDILAIGVSENARLMPGTEDFSLKYRLYGFNGEYDKYGEPINEWYSDSKTDSKADLRDAGGYAFNVNFPSLNNNKRQYIKNIRGYMKVDVEPEGSSWGGERYDVFSHYLHTQYKIHWSGSVSIPLGGSIAFEYEDDVQKITGHTSERIRD